MAAPKFKIDLLSKQDLTKRSAGKLLLWALTVGRYIAIFTELVVIAGVIARFTLDYQRNQITEDVLEQQAIVKSYRPTEIKARQLEERLSTLSQIEKQRLEADTMIEQLAAITPLDLRFELLEFSHESLDLSGSVLSSQGLAVFLSGLQTLPEFSDIVLESVETGGPQDPSIHFDVSIDFISQTTAQKSKQVGQTSR